MIERDQPLTDPIIWLTAIATAVASYVITGNREEAAAGGAAVIAVGVLAAAILRVRSRDPRVLLPGLTPRQSRIAMLVYAGYDDHAIAFRLGMAPASVARRVEAIKARWHLASRDDIRERVKGIFGPPAAPVEDRPPGLAEWLGLVGIGLATAFGGLSVLALPPEDLGWARDPIGLSLVAAGVLIVLVTLWFWMRSRGPRP